MTENERVATSILVDLMRAAVAYLTDELTAEQFLTRLRVIFKDYNM